MIAYEPTRAWLLLADAGERLGIGGSPEPWLDVLPRYAELQLGEAARAGEHLAVGVPDRGLARYPALYEAAVARRLPLRARDEARLRAFAPRFAELCAELAAAGIPETNDTTISTATTSSATAPRCGSSTGATPASPVRS